MASQEIHLGYADKTAQMLTSNWYGTDDLFVTAALVSQ